jgi:hypothetical protein
MTPCVLADRCLATNRQESAARRRTATGTSTVGTIALM